MTTHSIEQDNTTTIPTNSNYNTSKDPNIAVISESENKDSIIDQITNNILFWPLVVAILTICACCCGVCLYCAFRCGARKRIRDQSQEKNNAHSVLKVVSVDNLPNARGQNEFAKNFSFVWTNYENITKICVTD